jgi:thymidylate synthase (FAD)
MDKWHNDFDPVTDVRLLDYLAHHQHFTPFAQTAISLRVTTSIAVSRQLERHIAGLVMGTAIPTRNEVSRRYVDARPAFFHPRVWRRRAVNVKQGSGDALDEESQRIVSALYEEAIVDAERAYADLLVMGVCPEQARLVLPQSMMTTWIWTGSLAAYARVCTLRLDRHAQAETREVAEQIDTIIAPRFPEAWAALRRYTGAKINGRNLNYPR